MQANGHKCIEKTFYWMFDAVDHMGGRMVAYNMLVYRELDSATPRDAASHALAGFGTIP
jgi:hypothetical protein